MADIARVATAGVDTSTAMFAPQITGNLLAGEALPIAAPCYIKASDNKVYMSDGGADDEAARVHGFTGRATKVGESVTLFGAGTRLRYGASLTVGPLYLGAEPGVLSDTPTVGGRVPIATAISATDIIVGGGITGGRPRIAVSGEITANGSAQNFAHGLGAVPYAVVVTPTDTSPSTAGVFTVTEGSHSATNAVVTVTSGKKYKVTVFG